jgi:Gpi18-like mannosyltransferase
VTSSRRYELSIVAVFLVVLVAYLLIALVFHAPRGYYGTIEQPRFADPWIARSETVLSGGVLYRDVFTSTPPLTNFLIILPSLVPILAGNVNPWATLSFMLFFSLFNLFTALVLFRMGYKTAAGFWAAVLFLLNPLTFGNTVLRRQDESILVFFFALSLLLILRDENTKAAIAIGLALLIKLSAGLLIPVALLHKRDWRYLVIPPAIFLLALAPFLILAGRDAIFWDFTTRDAQHPFQFDGVSLVALWNRFHVESGQVPLLPIAIIMILGVAAAIAFIVWRRLGVIESLIVLTTVVFVLSPKLHTGYFSLLVMLLAPFIKDWKMAALYLLFGTTAIVADYYKWPIADFQIAFWIMVVVLAFMVFLAVGVRLQSQSGQNFDLIQPDN